jgi:hypothetical protein
MGGCGSSRTGRSARSSRSCGSRRGPPHRTAAPARLAVALVALAVGTSACDTDGSGAAADDATAELAASHDQPDAAAALEALVTAMEMEDAARVIELAVGPARAFFLYQLHLSLAEGGKEPLYPNLRVERGESEELSAWRVRFPGPLGFGTQEGAPPRILTDLEFVEDAADGTWRLERFVRNGHQIAAWVSPPGDEARVEVGPVGAQVVGLFSDVACNTGSDTGCPEWARNKVAVAFLVTNGSAGPLVPAPIELPDGTSEPAWLETSSGAAHPLFDAATTGLPGGRSSPVVTVFPGADDLAEGGALHLGLASEVGEHHQLSLPVPPYPHPWDRPRGSSGRSGRSRAG